MRSAMQPAADVHVLHRSSVGRVLNFHCKQPGNGTAQREYESDYGAVFTRRGAFEWRVGRQSACVHSALLLLDNAGTERSVKHYGTLRDECTDIEFAPELFRRGRDMAFGLPRTSSLNGGFKRLTIPVTPVLESLHALIIDATMRSIFVPSLRVDLLIVDLLREIDRICGGAAEDQHSLDRKSREYYLENIDRAKNVMRARFRENISLENLARVAGISVFHFSRIFKLFTTRAPHQYLIELRLEHARTLLRNTRLSVTEICFDSGFASLEHFLATFRRRYKMKPRDYRNLAKASFRCDYPALAGLT